MKGYPLAARASAAGFTLLEVLVAMTLIGLGLAVAFTVVSASTRLDGRMAGHQAAMTLARAKLDEVLAQPGFAVAQDAGEDRYAGTDFGYRIKLSPLEVMTPAQRQALPPLPQRLERVEIEVFWGPRDAMQSYRLVTYRVSVVAP